MAPMKVTLVERLKLKHGKEMDVSELPKGSYDVLFRAMIGRPLEGAYHPNLDLGGIRKFAEPLANLGTIYVSPSQEINYGIGATA